MADDADATTPAAVADEKPTAWRIGGVAVAGGLLISGLVHLVLVGTVLFVSPRLGYPEPVQSLPVDLVTPEELAKAMAQPDNADKAGNSDKADDKADQTDKPNEANNSDQADKIPLRTTPSTPQPSTPPQSTPPTAAPASTAEVAPTMAGLPAQPFAVPSSAPPLDPYTPSFASAFSPTHVMAPTRPAAPASDFAQMLEAPLPTASLSGGGPSDSQANLTSDEIAGFVAHVHDCWTDPPPGLAPNIYVLIRINLKRDGSLAGEPETIGGTMSAQAAGVLRPYAISALQKCPAYAGLPAAKYDEWRVLELRVTPNGISTASPAVAQRKPRQG